MVAVTFRPASPASRRSATSHVKRFERQLVHAWKTVTGATRKPQRASFLPQDFVLVTNRRRSIMFMTRT